MCQNHHPPHATPTKNPILTHHHQKWYESGRTPPTHRPRPCATGPTTASACSSSPADSTPHPTPHQTMTSLISRLLNHRIRFCFISAIVRIPLRCTFASNALSQLVMSGLGVSRRSDPSLGCQHAVARGSTPHLLTAHQNPGQRPCEAPQERAYRTGEFASKSFDPPSKGMLTVATDCRGVPSILFDNLCEHRERRCYVANGRRDIVATEGMATSTMESSCPHRPTSRTAVAPALVFVRIKFNAPSINAVAMIGVSPLLSATRASRKRERKPHVNS